MGTVIQPMMLGCWFGSGSVLLGWQRGNCCSLDLRLLLQLRAVQTSVIVLKISFFQQKPTVKRGRESSSPPRVASLITASLVLPWLKPRSKYVCTVCTLHVEP